MEKLLQVAVANEKAAEQVNEAARMLSVQSNQVGDEVDAFLTHIRE